MPCIYCVEDDENIRELVAYALESQQFETQTFADGESFYKVLEKKIPDLVLLDIMLPGESGIEILKKIRHKERTADLSVIMLTARTSEYDVVKGLTIGADDYVTKPFGILELISRIRAVLRRSHRVEKPSEMLVCGPVTLDPLKHAVSAYGEEVMLTAKEFELLHYLMMNVGIVLQREQIMESVWGFTYAGESRTIDMHIKSLRQKLGEGGQIIKTIRGVGYRLDEPES